MTSYNMEPIPNNADDIRALIALFPPEISAALEAAGDLDGLTEIVLDVGRRPAARYASAEIFLSPIPAPERSESVFSRRCGAS